MFLKNCFAKLILKTEPNRFWKIFLKPVLRNSLPNKFCVFQKRKAENENDTKQGSFLLLSFLILSGTKYIGSRFAAALIDLPLWVMNVIPVKEPDTLSVIFERGLIGVYHDWCESFNTYPRTYDLLHSSFLFKKLTQR